jgi:hypothetical protein
MDITELDLALGKRRRIEIPQRDPRSFRKKALRACQAQAGSPARDHGPAAIETVCEPMALLLIAADGRKHAVLSRPVGVRPRSKHRPVAVEKSGPTIAGGAVHIHGKATDIYG